MSELLRADYEYQKEIRRRQMTDRAKIGLLVGMNIQQFQTNQLLAQNLQVACHTNAILGQISDTLDQVAGMQATHFEQVQRERHLKEVIYQFDKVLTETEQYGDPVAVAYGVKRLFEVIDRPGHGFTTADLSDLGDKKQFDALLTRGKNAIRALPKEQFDELEEFEKLLGMYLQRRADGFNADRDFPKKPHAKLPVEFQHPPGMNEARLVSMSDWMNQMQQVGFFQWYKTFWIGKRNILIQAVAWFYMGFFWIPLWYLIASLAAQRRQLVYGNQQGHEAAVQEWKTKRAEFEKKLLVENQRIDAHNAGVEENRQKAKRIFDATMSEMRSLINGFLGQHPAIQQFVARV